MPSLIIQKILETRKITDYLAKKHIYASSQENNGKLKYLCPLHQEKTPSFYVYTESEYENYYCFGCKAKYNIIHLYRDLEKVSLGEAIRTLAEGLEVDINAEISSAIADIEADIVATSDFSIADFALMINQQLYHFTKMVENDPTCMEQVERMGKVVDKALSAGDIESLRTVNDKLMDVLTQRVRIYQEEQEAKLLKQR